MKRVAEVIDRETDGITVYDKAPMVDAVSITTDSRSKIRLVVFGIISRNAVKTENHITHLPVTVRYHKRNDTATVVGNVSLYPG